MRYRNHEVSLTYTSYRSNGSLAVEMNTLPDRESYAFVTVNLGSPLQNDVYAFVDENNLPGIGAWLEENGIATASGYQQRSGFCVYPLYKFIRI